ncbi:hypothetical protein A176_007315 [Myxococcus hansupus]|uniref:Lipoprotein n=1 Tax=Pseudomyxococcus hansupus TaxID=1297742 RepID=A0A0H4X8T1_9BACT|nr:hypothetical protein [Myxococcus hansupus]AKQ70403.1 hypothetical protein A176_007315 [Myxococcus hansupus]
MRTPFLAVLLVIPAALSCTADAFTFGASHEDFLRRPDRVQIFLADHPTSWGRDYRDLPPGVKEEDLPRSGKNFVLPQEGPELSKEHRKQLAAAFVPASEPNPIPEKKCGFNPDIALRYWRGNTWMDVIVCLGCIQFIYIDAKGEQIASRNVGVLSDYTFLYQLAKEAFPEENFRFLR